MENAKEALAHYCKKATFSKDVSILLMYQSYLRNDIDLSGLTILIKIKYVVLPEFSHNFSKFLVCSIGKSFFSCNFLRFWCIIL